MTALEITLIVIGVVFLVGSFFVSDKLSQKDVDQILQNFVNHDGKRYASNQNYENDLTKTRNSIISKYPGLINDYICFG